MNPSNRSNRELIQLWNSWEYAGHGKNNLIEYRRPLKPRKNLAILQQIKNENRDNAAVLDQVNALQKTIIIARFVKRRYILLELMPVLAAIVIIFLLIFFYPTPRAFDKWMAGSHGYIKTTGNAAITWKVPSGDGFYTMKRVVPPATTLKILGHWNGGYLWVETPDKERGLMNYRYLENAAFGTLKNNAEFREGKAWREGTPRELKKGNRLKMIEPVKNETGNRSEFLYVELTDGSRGLIKYWDFLPMIIDAAPTLNIEYNYRLRKDRFESAIQGKRLKGLEGLFGKANAVFRYPDSLVAVFEGLVLVNEGRRSKGVSIVFPGNKPLKWKSLYPPEKAVVENLPLASFARGLNLNLFIGTLFFSVRDLISDMGGKSWMVKSARWFLIIFGGIVLFSIPWIFIWPVNRLFTLVKSLPNKYVTTLTMIVSGIFYYFYFLVLSLQVDNAWLVLFLSALFFFLWNSRLRARLNYYRCPNCRYMFTTGYHGTRFAGKPVERVLPGNVNRMDALPPGNIFHLECNTRMCARCGYNRDLERNEIH
jgi:hypothetical protein